MKFYEPFTQLMKGISRAISPYLLNVYPNISGISLYMFTFQLVSKTYDLIR
jgi:hypothetical protein